MSGPKNASNPPAQPYRSHAVPTVASQIASTISLPTESSKTASYSFGPHSTGPPAGAMMLHFTSPVTDTRPSPVFVTCAV